VTFPGKQESPFLTNNGRGALPNQRAAGSRVKATVNAARRAMARHRTAPAGRRHVHPDCRKMASRCTAGGWDEAAGNRGAGMVAKLAGSPGGS